MGEKKKWPAFKTVVIVVLVSGAASAVTSYVIGWFVPLDETIDTTVSSAAVGLVFALIEGRKVSAKNLSLRMAFFAIAYTVVTYLVLPGHGG